jgi:hypothetical protein
MKKRSLIITLAMLGFFVGSDMAGATCVQAGKVNRLRVGTAAEDFLEILPLADVPPFVTTYTVTTSTSYILLAAAQGTNLSVIVTGDAAHCQTTGFYRAGGHVIEVDVHRNE